LSKNEVLNNACTFCAQYVLHTEPYFWSRWGKNYDQSSDVIVESNSLVVVAGLGALVEGYVLILPKIHYLSIGAIPPSEMAELMKVKDKVRSLIGQLYGPVTLFEHGTSPSHQAGGCINHAHLHVFPCNADFRPHLGIHVEHRLSAIDELSEFASASIPYLYYENADGDMFAYEVSEHLPSQYLRRIWAKSIGKPQEWDWAVFVGEEQVAKTIAQLRSALQDGYFL
jgi:diadenosine tetraphosphate (Ap4A) HIT family hydrolase